MPNGVYARGSHHLTNGATWIEQFALEQGLSGTVRPALLNPGIQASNYAVAGARAQPVTDTTPADDVNRCRFNLSNQVETYLANFKIDDSNPIPADTLFAIEMGGNDVRDALNILLNTGNAAAAQNLMQDAINNIAGTIQTLRGLGARKFLLVNVPNIGRTPTIRLLDQLFTPPSTPTEQTVIYNANVLSMGFDSALAALQGQLSGLPDIKIRKLDTSALKPVQRDLGKARYPGQPGGCDVQEGRRSAQRHARRMSAYG